MSERNLFYRSPTQTVRETRVVNDPATADVDSVMQIAATRCDEVRAQRRFLVTGQEPIAVRAVDGEYIRLLHGSVTRLWGYG
jgi:hypothetical protein